jgi:hypothetical protein
MAVAAYVYDRTGPTNYTDFAAWLAAIGATPKSIIIGVDVEITGTVVISSTIDIVGFYKEQDH